MFCQSVLPGSLFWMCHQSIVTGSPPDDVAWVAVLAPPTASASPRPAAANRPTRRRFVWVWVIRSPSGCCLLVLVMDGSGRRRRRRRATHDERGGQGDVHRRLAVVLGVLDQVGEQAHGLLAERLDRLVDGGEWR